MLLSSPAVEKTIVGFCVSWIVVRDLAPEKIFETIGMKVSAKPADPLALHWSAPWSAYYSYRDLKNGWHVIEAVTRFLAIHGIAGAALPLAEAVVGEEAHGTTVEFR